MLDHYIQKNIVYNLALTPSMRFSDLKPDDTENKLFDYHLKKVIATGLVTKNQTGEYELTPTGRRVGKDALKKTDHLINRVYSVLFIAIRRQSDGAWLLCRRKAHPLLGKVGFMHAVPDLDSTAPESAAAATLEKTGLQATFTVRGSGYLRVYEGEDMESFTHFTLLEAKDAIGDLQQLDSLSEYYWQTTIDIEDPDLLPSIPYFIDALEKPGLFYFEKTLNSSIS